jgi:hypothetical protein
MKPGDTVRMTEAFKKKLRGECTLDNHVAPVFGEDEKTVIGCLRCSLEHIEEFGECVGTVIDLVDYNNVPKNDPSYDPAKVGPEWNVRWGLRYTYHPDELEIV